MDQKLIIWDLQHSLSRSTCNHEDGVTCLSWLGTSKYLVTGCVHGKVEFGMVFAVTVYEHSAVTLMPFSLSLYLLFKNPSFRFQLMGLPVFEIAEFRRATKAPSYSFKLFFLFRISCCNLM